DGPAEESLRTSDLLARALFSQLRNRTIHERRYVLEALIAASNGGEMTSPRMRVMKASLAWYQAESGKIPAKVAYERWRKEQDDPGLCPANRMIRHFSTWNRALNDLGIKPMPDPPALRVLSRGQQISDEEVLQALRDCAADLGSDNFTIAQYEKWAKAELLKPENRGRKIPISKSIATRRWGTVRQAKIAAGLDPNSPYHSTGHFTDEELLDQLIGAREQIEGRLSTAKYAVWRKAKLEEARRRGEVIRVPCAFTFHSHFGGWLNAVAKIEGLPINPHEHRGPPVYTPDWLAEQLLIAYDELGEPFFTSSYVQWVRDKRKEVDVDFPPPDYTTVTRHGVSWPEVRDKVRVAIKTGNIEPLIEQFKKGGMNG
ncbi:MAG TPA: hypothetical protein P5138_08230, partial [Solirubrobacterales bacterium]|nr:hypothetical protein [Solirubrobacterales bacterium]